MNSLHIVKQQLQRTILSEMNIDWWIGNQQKTIQFNDINIEENQSVDNKLALEINFTKKTTPEIPSIKTVTKKPISQKTENPPKLKETKKEENPKTETEQLIEPFQLEAIYYNHWVLVVDKKYLDNQEIQQLWNTMCQKLATKVEKQKFPFATEINIPTLAPKAMNTLKLANTVLISFFYRVAQYSDFKLVKLTQWAEGLQHDKLQASPTLQQMVDNPQIKKQFWQTISQK